MTSIDDMTRATRSTCCGDLCFAEDRQEELGKCWGDVEVIEEEYTDDEHWWIHACAGHREMYSGDMKYREEK